MAKEPPVLSIEEILKITIVCVENIQKAQISPRKMGTFLDKTQEIIAAIKMDRALPQECDDLNFLWVLNRVLAENGIISKEHPTLQQFQQEVTTQSRALINLIERLINAPERRDDPSRHMDAYVAEIILNFLRSAEYYYKKTNEMKRIVDQLCKILHLNLREGELSRLLKEEERIKLDEINLAADIERLVQVQLTPEELAKANKIVSDLQQIIAEEKALILEKKSLLIAARDELLNALRENIERLWLQIKIHHALDNKSSKQLQGVFTDLKKKTYCDEMVKEEVIKFALENGIIEIAECAYVFLYERDKEYFCKNSGKKQNEIEEQNEKMALRDFQQLLIQKEIAQLKGAKEKQTQEPERTVAVLHQFQQLTLSKENFLAGAKKLTDPRDEAVQNLAENVTEKKVSDPINDLKVPTKRRKDCCIA